MAHQQNILFCQGLRTYFQLCLCVEMQATGTGTMSDLLGIRKTVYWVCIACSDSNIVLVFRSFNTFRSTVLYVVSVPLSVG